MIIAKHNNKTVYINPRNVVALGANIDRETKSWVDCTSGEGYNLDLSVEEILKQVREDEW